MRAAAVVLTLALLGPGTASAACAGLDVLSCPVGKKQLDLCLTGEGLTYSFGPKGRPELVMTDPIRKVDYQPWSGVGRSIWDAVRFFNKGVSYEVWTSLDRLDENAVWEGGVIVSKGGETLAELQCARGSVRTDLYAVYEAKLVAGQCWNREMFAWQAAPCPED